MLFSLVYCTPKASPIQGAISLLNKPIPNPVNTDTCYLSYCNRRIRYFEFDTTYYLDEKYSDSPYILEDCFDCALLKIVLNANVIDLDSVYRTHFDRKIRYMGGFVRGTYLISNGLIQLNLIFINVATNTSSSTAHEYNVVYDSRKRKVISVDMCFLDD